MVTPGTLGRVTSRDNLLAAVVAAVWGFNFVVIEWGMGDVPPLLFLAARFLVVLVPAILLVPRPDVPLRVVLTVGLFMSLGQFALLYVSMDVGMPPGLAGLVLQAQVVLTIVFAGVALRERPSRAQVIGVLLGTAGLVVVGLGRGGHVPALAFVLCLLAASAWAVGNVLSRASGAKGGLPLTVWSALVVPVPLVGLSLALDGPGSLTAAADAFGWEAAVSTLYTAGLASLVGYGIFNGLLSRNPSAAVVPWILLVPPVAMGSAALLLGERPSAGELAGGAVLVLGAFVALRSGGRAAVAPKPVRQPGTREREVVEQARGGASGVVTSQVVAPDA